MQWKLLHNIAGERVFVLIFQTEDEAMAGLQQFAQQQHLTASGFTAIGAFEHAVLGYFRWDRKEYQHIPINEQTEVLTLVGDITLENDRPKVHAHVVLGLSDGTTRGGHVLEAHVRPTLEVFLRESPSSLRRVFDPTAHISLIRPNASSP